MAKVIKESKSGGIIGHVGLGFRGGISGSVRQQVYDGDTISVRAIGNLGVRFLGVDAPEVSFRLPGEPAFIGLSNEKWERYLKDPFIRWPSDTPLDRDLINYLRTKLKPGAAANHHRHATRAEDELEREVLKDLRALGQSEEEFRFFLGFAYEVMDRYGRWLAFVNRDQPKGRRPLSYNERLLKAGVVMPYFIWPNISPFRKRRPLIHAVIEPKKAREEANKDEVLRRARKGVRRARQEGRGVFRRDDPLQLEPFEVRFLGDQRRPTRWVIDLSKDDDLLIPPESYFIIPNQEDRLFVPEEYVPLFVERGWRRKK